MTRFKSLAKLALITAGLFTSASSEIIPYQYNEITSYGGGFYTDMINVGDVNGDGNEDIIGIRNASFELIKLNDEGKPIGGSSTISYLYEDGASTDAFLSYYDSFVPEDNNQFTHRAHITDGAYIGKDGENTLFAINLARSMKYRIQTSYTKERGIQQATPVIITIKPNGQMVSHYPIEDYMFNKYPISMNSFDRPCSKISTSIKGVGDIDGDGINDLAVSYGIEDVEFVNEEVFPYTTSTTQGHLLFFKLQQNGTPSAHTVFNAIDNHGITKENFPAGVEKLELSIPDFIKVDEKDKIGYKNYNNEINWLGDIDGNGTNDFIVGGVMLSINSDLVIQPEIYDITPQISSVLYSHLDQYPERILDLGDIDGDGTIEVTGRPTTNVNAAYREIYSIVKASTGSDTPIEFVKSYDLTISNGCFPNEIATNYIHNTGFIGNAENHNESSAGTSVVVKNKDGAQFLYVSDNNQTGTSPASWTLWYISLDEVPDVDPRTDVEKMLSFSGSEYWETVNADGTTRTFEQGNKSYDSDMLVAFDKGSTWQRLRGTVPYDGLVGSDANRVRMEVGVKVPVDEVHHWDYLTYRGNLQLCLGGNWVGQFDINGTEAVGDAALVDGWYVLHYSFLVPNTVVEEMKRASTTIEIAISAVKEGEVFEFEWINFLAEDVDEGGRDIYEYINEKVNLTSIPSWSQIYNGGGIKVLNKDGDGYHTAVRLPNGNLGFDYYVIRQDVDYPMDKVEWWAGNWGYKPGSPSGAWRQCWMFIGSKK